MESMFSDCILLQNLNLSNFDTTNVEDMSSMFKGCISLKYLIIILILVKFVQKCSISFQV